MTPHQGELLRDLRARADKADFGLIDNDYKWVTLKDDFLEWAKQAVRDWEKYEQDLAKFEEYVTVPSFGHPLHGLPPLGPASRRRRNPGQSHRSGGAGLGRVSAK